MIKRRTRCVSAGISDNGYVSLKEEMTSGRQFNPMLLLTYLVLIQFLQHFRSIVFYRFGFRSDIRRRMSSFRYFFLWFLHIVFHFLFYRYFRCSTTYTTHSLLSNVVVRRSYIYSLTKFPLVYKPLFLSSTPARARAHTLRQSSRFTFSLFVYVWTES